MANVEKIDTITEQAKPSGAGKPFDGNEDMDVFWDHYVNCLYNKKNTDPDSFTIKFKVNSGGNGLWIEESISNIKINFKYKPTEFRKGRYLKLKGHDWPETSLLGFDVIHIKKQLKKMNIDYSKL
ncbi:MAG: hypothetical protein SVZ03_11545 [Spirochaetota bacterium]|nr:hypothetical protein [Spirochaetota bacterium]